MIEYLINSGALLSPVIQKDPGIIVGPITKFLGYILNWVFEFGWFFSPSGANCLGISIILLTIITRALMIPLAFKQQKSTFAMQSIMPEVNKIKEKYGNSKDPQVQQKIAAETQALYSKHKINPLSGCLPSLIQLPIFFALNYMIQQSYQFINKIGAIYQQIATTLINMPNFEGFVSNTFMAIADPKVPKNMLIDLGLVSDMEKVINKLTSADWQVALANVPGSVKIALDSLLQQKSGIEHFLGINLIEKSGWSFPGIIIPILAVITTFLSTYLMNKASAPTADPNTQSTQKVMLYMMPLMMGYFTITFSAGVGLYWITSTVFQIAQQFFINKYYKPKLSEKLGKDGKE